MDVRRLGDGRYQLTLDAGELSALENHVLQVADKGLPETIQQLVLLILYSEENQKPIDVQEFIDGDSFGG